jgi:hypothetical protein
MLERIKKMYKFFWGAAKRGVDAAPASRTISTSGAGYRPREGSGINFSKVLRDALANEVN